MGVDGDGEQRAVLEGQDGFLGNIATMISNEPVGSESAKDSTDKSKKFTFYRSGRRRGTSPSASAVTGHRW